MTVYRAAKFLALSSLFASSVASPWAAARDSRDLFADKKPAVVKIVVKELGVQISNGTGFFIAKDGSIVTNLHVLEPAFTAGKRVEITNADGKVAKSVQVAGCGGEKQVDLCLLKTDLVPKSWIPVNGLNRAPEGEKIYIVGHPMGLNYTLTDGMVSGYRKDPSAKKDDPVEMVQVSAPVYSGNSGGPIFNSKGLLVGVVTAMKAQTQGFNFGITNSEVGSFIRQYKSFSPIEDFQKNLENSRKAQAEKRIALLRDLKPDALKTFVLKRPDDERPSPPRITLPVWYAESCSPYGEGKVDRLVCKDSESGARLVFEAHTNARNRIDKTWRQNGKRPAAVPLAVTRVLQKQGRWKTEAKRLGANAKLFFSDNAPVKCRLEDGWKTCVAQFQRYETAENVRVVTEAQRVNDDRYLSFEIQYGSPAYANYFAALSDWVVSQYQSSVGKGPTVVHQRTMLEFEGVVKNLREGQSEAGDYLEFELRTADGENLLVHDFRQPAGRVPAAERGVRPDAKARIKGYFTPGKPDADGNTRVILVVPAAQ